MAIRHGLNDFGAYPHECSIENAINWLEHTILRILGPHARPASTPYALDRNMGEADSAQHPTKSNGSTSLIAERLVCE